MDRGTKLGPYEIVAPLGAGGMGEVYRAKDTRLDRDVAIKVLPEEMSRDKERLRRFEREARLLASLDHPNIATIHGFEEVEDTRFLVLECVEGETLAARLKHSPVPVDQALRIAECIAEALEVAHENGVIHRDLKPGNVMLKSDGSVKVLDFGLAKAMPRPPGSAGPGSPTITADYTRPGAVLGTPAYMSPEQAGGRAVDERTDIFSFGVILYEMLTGASPFAGGSAQDTMGAILHTEPDWSVLPAAAPAALVRLIKRCLRKDPKRRLRDVGDARNELQDILAGEDESTEEILLQKRRSPVPWLAGGALLGIVLVLAGTSVFRTSPSAQEQLSGGAVSFTAPLPEGLVVAGPTGVLAVSPDGSRLVFGTHDGETAQLYLRSLREAAARPLTGTEGAAAPFFSPDGQWIGFLAAGQLWKMPVTGGEPVALRHALAGGYLGSACWADDGTIVIADGGYPIHRLPAIGGEGEAITRPDVEAGETAHLHPEVLPGGRTVLFTVVTGGVTMRIAALDLEGRTRSVVLEEGSQPQYVEGGYLVYRRGDRLMGVPFDAENVRVMGSPVPLLGEDVAVRFLGQIGLVDVSRNGHLAYIAARDAMPKRALLKVDRNGVAEPLPVEERGYQAARLTRDGTWLAVATEELDDAAIWVSPMDRIALARLPLKGQALNPVWHPDGRHLAFLGTADGQWDLYSAPIDGSSSPLRLTDTIHAAAPTSWSADGRNLIFQNWTAPAPTNVRLLRWPNDESPPEVETLVGRAAGGTLSPDGRWLAYSSGGEIYVQEFPGGGNRRQVSVRGGWYPVWSPLGDELFYVRDAPYGVLQLVTGSKPEFIAVHFHAGPEPAFGEEKVLFAKHFYYGRWGWTHYDVAPDAGWFVIPGPDRGSAPTRIHVILNWKEQIRQRLQSP